MDRSFCPFYVYSEEYLNFLIKYDGDLTSVEGLIRPDCISVINDTFLAAYRAFGEGGYSPLDVGYNSIPKCFSTADISALEQSGITELALSSGLSLTGRGVLIGFVDTGIDYLSPAFRTSAGTRILYMWDQNEYAVGSGNAAYGYGAEYTKSMIDEAIMSNEPYSLIPGRDENGHGTFIASVAAAGYDEEEGFAGAAPESGLIVVKLKEAKQNLKDYYFIRDGAACFEEDDIVFGIKYLLDKADELGMPIVICLGLCSTTGDHGGNSNIEQYLELVSELRGVCVVSAVGNELSYGGHYRKNAYFSSNTAGDNLSYENIYAVRNSLPAEEFVEDVEIDVQENCRGAYLELWSRSPELLSLTIISPTGESFRVPDYNTNAAWNYRFLYEGTRLFIENIVVELSSGDQLMVVRLEAVTAGIWTLRVKRQAGISLGFDCWLMLHELLDGEIRFIKADPEITLCIPATGRGSISVAGYNHNNASLYVRSGRGYSRGGLVKPEITAPAVDVAGVFATPSDRLLYTRRSGTSVGAAITAGAAALVLEWMLVRGFNQGANTQVIRQLLIRGARQVQELKYPNPLWGYGALDLDNSFELLRGGS